MSNFTFHFRAKTTIAMFLVTSIVSATASAQVSTWLIPGDGFFENPTNWSPDGVPGQGDNIRFLLQLEQRVALFNDHTVAALEANNGAQVEFGIAGPSSLRTLQVNGEATFEDGAVLAVAGNEVDSFVLDIQGDLTGPEALSLSGGGVLNAQLATFEATQELPITIEGRNSALIVDRLVIDHTSGPFPELTISNGASVTSQTFTDFGRVNITMAGEDVNGNGSRWNTADFDLVFGDLRVSDGAVVTSNHVDYGGFGTGSPDTILSGRDSAGRPTTWNIAGVLDMAGSFPNIDVREGAQLLTKDVITSAATASEIEVGDRISPTPGVISRWIADGDVYLGGTETAPAGFTDFDVDLNGEVHVSGTMKLWNEGGFRMHFGSRVVANRIENTLGGVFTFSGGILETNMFVGDLENRLGTLTPGGDEAGLTTIVGDYTQLAESTLAIDIGGTTPIADHDLLETAGFTFLDGGALELELINGFTPAASDEFVIGAMASIVGSFDNVLNGERLATLDGAGSFIVNYGFGSAFDMRNIVLSDFLLASVLFGDYDGDGFVGAGDLDLVLGAWGNDVSVTGVPTGWVNQLPMGLIGAAELDDVLSNWGAGSSPSLSAVPEPSAAMLVVLGIVGLVRPRRC